MRTAILGVLGGLSLFCTASPANASTFLAMDLPELAAQSDAVVVGKVTEVESMWTPDGRVIISEATVVVERQILGDVEPQVTVRTFGGTVDDYNVVAHGFPTFSAGDRVLLFLQPDGDAMRVTGYQLGHYNVTERNGALAVVPTLDPGTFLFTADGLQAVRPEAHDLATFTRRLREGTSMLDGGAR